MDEALIKVGLPVHCAGVTVDQIRCEVHGFVRPGTDYDGWYKSKLLRGHSTKRWFCPEHAQVGREIDDAFYARFETPASEQEHTVINDHGTMAVPEGDGQITINIEDDFKELYDLLD